MKFKLRCLWMVIFSCLLTTSLFRFATRRSQSTELHLETKHNGETSFKLYNRVVSVDTSYPFKVLFTVVLYWLTDAITQLVLLTTGSYRLPVRGCWAGLKVPTG